MNHAKNYGQVRVYLANQLPFEHSTMSADIENRYPLTWGRFDQSFEHTEARYYNVYSYNTCIASIPLDEGEERISPIKYSRTTSVHMNMLKLAL